MWENTLTCNPDVFNSVKCVWSIFLNHIMYHLNVFSLECCENYFNGTFGTMSVKYSNTHMCFLESMRESRGFLVGDDPQNLFSQSEFFFNCNANKYAHGITTGECNITGDVMKIINGLA